MAKCAVANGYAKCIDMLKELQLNDVQLQAYVGIVGLDHLVAERCLTILNQR